jgi:hypothetical protein
MRDCSQQLERELATITAERDHWQEIAKAASAEREHNANVAQEMIAERDQLRAEVERLRADRDCEKRIRKDAEEFRENAIERAEKAEAELAKYLSACPASPTEEERKRCQQWWAISGKSP